MMTTTCRLGATTKKKYLFAYSLLSLGFAMIAYMRQLKISYFSYVSQRALRGRARARLTGALSKGGEMRGVATNVYLWKTSGKPKETGQNENSKFESCIYA